MKRSSRCTRRRALTAAGVAVASLAWAVLPWGPAPEAVAFDRSWFMAGCTNVAASETGLWDDAPGAGVGSESGLVWMVTNQTANERCTYESVPQGVNTTDFPQLQVRMAVNDGAIVSVTVRTGSEFCGLGTTVGLVRNTGTEDHSGFVTRSVTLPVGRTLTDVCITITDDPDTVTSRRASALIDDIRVWNPRTGSTGWRESFSRPS